MTRILLVAVACMLTVSCAAISDSEGSDSATSTTTTSLDATTTTPVAEATSTTSATTTSTGQSPTPSIVAEVDPCSFLDSDDLSAIVGVDVTLQKTTTTERRQDCWWRTHNSYSDMAPATWILIEIRTMNSGFGFDSLSDEEREAWTEMEGSPTVWYQNLGPNLYTPPQTWVSLVGQNASVATFTPSPPIVERSDGRTLHDLIVSSVIANGWPSE